MTVERDLHVPRVSWRTALLLKLQHPVVVGHLPPAKHLSEALRACTNAQHAEDDGGEPDNFHACHGDLLYRGYARCHCTARCRPWHIHPLHCILSSQPWALT